MRARCVAIGLTLVSLAALIAGEGSPYERAIVQMIGSLDKMTAVLKTIEAEDSAQASRPELRKAADIWVETRIRAAKLQPPEREEKERLTKIFRPKIDEALKKMFVEVQRVSLIPGGKEALKEIAGVLKKDGK